MRHRTASAFLFAITFLLFAPHSRAAVIYNTLGALDSYAAHFFTISSWRESSCFFSYCSTTTNLREGMAVPFTVSGGNHTLDRIEVALAFNPSSTSSYGDVTLSLMENNGGLPGNTIESYNISLSSYYSFPGQLFSRNSSTHPQLENGQTYWLGAQVLEPPGTGTLESDIVWFLTPQGIPSDYVYRRDGFGGFFSYPTNGWLTSETPQTTAFRISGTPVVVPIPSAAMLFLSGLMGMALIRRKKSVRITAQLT